MDILSERENKVMQLVEQGKSNPQIAGELGFSVGTVKQTISNVLKKTRAANRTEAIAILLKHNHMATV